MFKKYLQIIKNEISIKLIYKWNVLTEVFSRIVGIIVLILLWRGIMYSAGEVKDYNMKSIISYLTVSHIMFQLYTSEHISRLPNLIKSGNLSGYILRPYSFLGYCFATYVGSKVIVLLLMVIIIIVLVLTNLMFIELSKISILLLISNFILQFIFGSFIGTLGFWVIETWPLHPLYSSLSGLLGGALYPLDLLPSKIYETIKYNPFSLFIHVNTLVLQGRLSQMEEIQFLIVSILWTVIFYIGYKISWEKGIKKYEGVGI